MSESGGVSMVDFLKALWSEGCNFDAYEKVAMVVLASRTHCPGSVLYKFPDKVAQSILARECSVGRQKLVTILKRLTGDGYILRKNNEGKRMVQQYCLTAKVYVDYLKFLESSGRCIEKGLAILGKINPEDPACQIDLASQISSCRPRRHLNESVVVNSDTKSDSVVVNSDKQLSSTATHKEESQEEFKRKEESPPTPQTGVGGLGGGVSSFSFFPSLRHFRVFYNNAIKTGLLTGAWPEHLPRRTERALESTIAKYPMSDWAKYFRALKPVLADYSGQTGFPRIILERPTFEARIKDFQNKGKK